MHAKQRPSDHKASRGIIPPTDSNLEFELIARHGIIYPKMEPISIARLDALVDSTVLDTMPRPTQPDAEAMVLTDSAIRAPGNSRPRPGFGAPAASAAIDVSGPSSNGKYCDPRLNRLKIGFWTGVPIPDELAAAVLSFYLENDHPLLAFFDADLFLDDLVEQRLTFCSALLVSSLLYLSCVGISHRPCWSSY